MTGSWFDIDPETRRVRDHGRSEDRHSRLHRSDQHRTTAVRLDQVSRCHPRQHQTLLPNNFQLRSLETVAQLLANGKLYFNLYLELCPKDGVYSGFTFSCHRHFYRTGSGTIPVCRRRLSVVNSATDDCFVKFSKCTFDMDTANAAFTNNIYSPRMRKINCTSCFASGVNFDSMTIICGKRTTLHNFVSNGFIPTADRIVNPRIQCCLDTRTAAIRIFPTARQKQFSSLKNPKGCRKAIRLCDSNFF